ncbi:MAG: hypothetical protein EA364_16375 [Balneolaceae bacterium]|nr:MAG: hypothetical protein EA364_16375 [Balneolaceae bacterium]
MKLGNPEISEQNGKLTYKVNVGMRNGEKRLWFSVPAEFGYMVSGLTDAALAALIIPAMKEGEPVHIKGEVTERLFLNIAGPVQRFLNLVLPDLKPVAFTAANTVKDGSRAGGVATGFSGGVDSYCLLADHHYDNSRKDLRISHLLYNNVGSHGFGGRGRVLFNNRFLQMKPFAERTGLPFIQVDSNLDEFFSGFKFVDTHTLRNASVAFLLQKGIGHYLYASSYSYMHIIPENLRELHLHDLILLPLLANDAMDIRTEGSQYTRLEKTKKISEIADTYDALNVCTKESENCSACYKCLRTLFALEIIGKLEQYGNSFNLDLYRKKRGRYLADLLNLKAFSDIELREAASRLGIGFPVRARVLAGLLRIRSKFS